MEFEIEIPAQFFGLNGFTMKFNSFIVKGPCPLLSLSTQYHEFMISVANYIFYVSNSNQNSPTKCAKITFLAISKGQKFHFQNESHFSLQIENVVFS